MILGHQYKIIKTFEREGRGKTYLVNDRTALDVPMVVKALQADPGAHNDAFVRRFGHLKHLQHPNLAVLFDLGRTSVTREHFYTREYVDGQDIVSATQKSDFSQVAILIDQVCRVLQFLHGCGCLHGNLKPSNILVAGSEGSGRPGTVKILDFSMDEPGRSIRRSQGNTRPYRAPESSTRRVTPRTDLYALGAVLHEILYGAVPGEKKSKAGAGGKKRARIKGIPADISDLLDQLLAPSPSDRPASAAQIQRKLDAMSGLTPHTSIPSHSFHFVSPILGRDNELARLKGMARDLVTQGGTLTPLVLVTGEPGSGKSRLLDEFRLDCQGAGLPVLSVQCAEERSSEVGVINRLFEQVQAHLGEQQTDIPRINALAPTRGDRFVGRAMDFLIEAARRINPVLILDDCDIADDASSEFLATLIAHLRFRYFEFGQGSERTPFLLVLSGRESQNFPRRTELLSIPHYEICPERWSVEEVGAFVQKALNLREAPGAFVEAIRGASKGVPRYVGEVLQ
ncbi:serine/threonine protein kinase, partial [Acidobacteriota bacterium]